MGGIYHKGKSYSRQMVVNSDLSKVSNNPLKNRAVTGLVNNVIAPVEGANASQAYAQGAELIFNNLLYKAKSAITQDTPFDAGSSGNIELAGTIVDQLKQLFADETILKKEPTKTDLNTNYQTTGLRAFDHGANCFNAPITGVGYVLDYTNSVGSDSWQIDIDGNLSAIYIRRRTSAITWDSWNLLYKSFSSDLITAIKTIRDGGGSICKVNRVANLIFSACYSSDTTASEELFTIPTAFKPKYGQTFPVYVQGGSITALSVNTSTGKVSVSSSSPTIPSGKWITGSATWITNN